MDSAESKLGLAGEVGKAPPCPVERVPGRLEARALVLCDHASNAIPPEFGALGLPPEQLKRHIAYDIGAAWVSRRLAARLGCPAILSGFSRLLIDPNRGLDDPTLVMRLSDGAVVPGNRHLNEAGIAERVRRFYAPYDAAVAEAIGDARALGLAPAVISIHSFTPLWKNMPRPWHVGVLWDRDARMAGPLLAALCNQPDLFVGDNEPYAGSLEGDMVDRHAVKAGLPHALIELRQDLIDTEAKAEAWADRLAPMLEPILAEVRTGQATKKSALPASA